MPSPSVIAQLARIEHGAEMKVRDRGKPEHWTPEQRESVAALAGAIAVRSMGAADELVQRALETTSAKDAAALANAGRNAAIVAGILTDKAQLLAGQPTSRAEQVNTAELRARLATILGLAQPVEANSHALQQPAELVEG